MKLVYFVAVLAAFAMSLESPLKFRGRTANLFRRVTGRSATLQRTNEELKSGIAKFYDESSSIWLDVWGEGLLLFLWCHQIV
jgi:hypothetical protein